MSISPPCKFWNGAPGSCKTPNCSFTHFGMETSAPPCKFWNGVPGSCATYNCQFSHQQFMYGMSDLGMNLSCKFWNGVPGSCTTYNCQFVHNTVSLPPKANTVCKFWNGILGSCTTHNCPFIHDTIGGLGLPGPSTISAPCKFWNGGLGSCKTANCPFIHNKFTSVGSRGSRANSPSPSPDSRLKAQSPTVPRLTHQDFSLLFPENLGKDILQRNADTNLSFSYKPIVATPIDLKNLGMLVKINGKPVDAQISKGGIDFAIKPHLEANVVELWQGAQLITSRVFQAVPLEPRIAPKSMGVAPLREAQLKGGGSDPTLGDLSKMRVWAKETQWKQFRKAHYDWWMFPTSTSSSPEYCVGEQEVRELRKLPDYMAGYNEAVTLVTRSWGWDVQKTTYVKNKHPDMKWESSQTTRLAKIGVSCFELSEMALFNSVRQFVLCLLKEEETLEVLPGYDISQIYYIEKSSGPPPFQLGHTKTQLNSYSQFGGSPATSLSASAEWLKRLDPVQKAVAIKREFQFLFSSSNWEKDILLQELQNKAGWISIKDILNSYPPIHKLTKGSSPESCAMVSVIIRESPELKMLLELSIDSKKTRRLNPSQLILKQLEFCFGESNFLSDLALQMEVEKTIDGQVAISTVTSWDRFKQIMKAEHSPDQMEAAILRAIKDSCVVYSSSKGYLRRMPLTMAIRKSIDILFKPINLPNLVHRIDISDEGFYAITDILDLTEIKSICPNPDPALVAEVLRPSDSIEVSPCSTKIRPKRNAPSFELMKSFSNPEVSLELPFPPWRYSEAENPGEFSVMTWNILAQKMYLGHSHYCPKEYLKWPYRKQSIQKHLSDLYPDILFLQEVQSGGGELYDHAKEMTQFLKKNGYETVYARKTSFAVVDLGNLVAWKSNVFDLLEHQVVELGTEISSLCTTLESKKHFVLPQVAVMALLRHKRTARLIVVCSTHIACQFDSPEKQVCQVSIILKHLSLLSNQSTIPIIFGGDFNMRPWETLYNFISRGMVNILPFEATYLPNVSFPALSTDEDGNLSHPVPLKSAMFELLGNEPKYTSMKPDFSGCLDYIWYSGEIIPRKYLLFPEHRLVKGDSGGIPNWFIPSDHLPLCINFSFQTRADIPIRNIRRLEGRIPSDNGQFTISIIENQEAITIPIDSKDFDRYYC